MNDPSRFVIGPSEPPEQGAPLRPLFDTRQLLAFSILAQTGSFTRAARDLDVTQSAVSHSIRSLEASIGCRLFERNSRKVQLTLAGEQFLHHVGRIHNEIAAAYESLQMLRRWGQTQLRIAAPTSICEVLLPRCLCEIRQRYPHSLISVAAADRPEAIAELIAGRADLAVVVGGGPDQRFEFHPLFHDELSFVLPPTHPWAQSPPSSPSAVGSEPLLTYRPQSYTRSLINDYFASLGIEPTVIVGCDSLAALREMVQLGMGVGVFAHWMVAKEIASGRLIRRPLGERPLIRRWGVLTLRKRPLSLAQTRLLESLRTLAPRAIDGIVPEPVDTSAANGDRITPDLSAAG